MVPKKGTTVQSTTSSGRRHCAGNIARALRAELGAGSHAAKIVMRWTGVSNRGARYWLQGDRCPNGWQMILMARHSDAVLREILQMCERPALGFNLEISAVRLALNQATAALSALEERGPEDPITHAR